MLKIVDVISSKEISKFITFPHKLYSGNPSYTPILYSEEHNRLSLGHNAALNFCEYHMYLVYDEKKIVGRVATVLNNKYNEEKHVKELRFTKFDCIDNVEVSNFIFDFVVKKAKEKGMNTIVGPLAFTPFDRLGMVCDNFNLETAYINNYNYEYYNDYLVRYGFNKKHKLYSYYLDVHEDKDDRFNKIDSFILNKYNLKIKTPDTLSNGEAMYMEAFDLLNEVNKTYDKDIYYLDVDKKLARVYALYLSQTMKLDFVIGVYDEANKLVAFMGLCPDISVALKRGNGKIGLITSMKLANILKDYRTMDMTTLIVDRKYQNCGLEGVMFSYALDKLNKINVQKIMTRPMLETSINKKITNGYEFSYQHEYAIYYLTL